MGLEGWWPPRSRRQAAREGRELMEAWQVSKAALREKDARRMQTSFEPASAAEK